MQDQRHHFYPAFCLRRWQGGDHRIQYFKFSKPANKVLSDRVSPDTACQNLNLYSFARVRPELRHALENNFFTPNVDTPAAKALQSMERVGVEGLSWSERESWSRFLLALPARTPEALNELGPNAARKIMDNEPEKYLELKAEQDPGSLYDYVEKKYPNLFADYVRRALPGIIFDDKHLPKMISMEWWIRELHGHQILTCDRPLLAYPASKNPNAFNLNDEKCTLVLPIGPHRIFVASSAKGTRKKMRAMTSARIARVVNDEVLRRAREYVFSFDKSLNQYVAERISRT